MQTLPLQCSKRSQSEFNGRQLTQTLVHRRNRVTLERYPFGSHNPMTNLWVTEKRRAHSLNLLSTESQLNQSYEICLTIAYCSLSACSHAFPSMNVKGCIWKHAPGNSVTARPALCYSGAYAATVMMCVRQLFIYRQAQRASLSRTVRSDCCNSYTRLKGLRTVTV